MADLIPSLSSCKPRMTRGERRLAERLEASLEAGCLLWYDVPVGRKARHPDFIVFHPRRGVLVLEVKDWRIESIRAIDRAQVELVTQEGIKHQPNPFEQSRQLGVCERCHDEQHGICASGARLYQLKLGGQEIFPQHRD